MNINYEQCNEYVTLLNLRNWEQIGTTYVTEQIYVHSKLMIVDDRFGLLGSANINDRSLLGERDSELAVLVIDGDVERTDLDGTGRPQPVRKFAHQLRKKVWRKIFGFTADELQSGHKGAGGGGANRAAHDLEFAINQPANPKSWRAIQKQAEINKNLYEAAFPYIPRDHLYGDESGAYASILPTWSSKLKNERGDIVGGLTFPLPFQDEFWTRQQHTANAAKLVGVKGFFTALPLHWTRDENIGITYPTAIIVKNDAYKSEASEHEARVASLNATDDSQELT